MCHGRLPQMHLHLQQQLPNRVKLPKFPARTAFFQRSMSTSFVEKRRDALSEYITTVAAISAVWGVPEFVHMLDGSRGVLREALSGLWEHDAAKEFAEVNSLVEAKEWGNLMASDQLTRERTSGRVFCNFQEGGIHFAPTYKFKVGEATYANKRDQNPSYCDRVLWHSRPGLERDVMQSKYDAVFSCMQSDHRPVQAVFSVRTRLPYALQREDVRKRSRYVTPRPNGPRVARGVCSHDTASRAAASLVGVSSCWRTCGMWMPPAWTHWETTMKPRSPRRRRQRQLRSCFVWPVASPPPSRPRPCRSPKTRTGAWMNACFLCGMCAPALTGPFGVCSVQAVWEHGDIPTIPCNTVSMRWMLEQHLSLSIVSRTMAPRSATLLKLRGADFVDPRATSELPQAALEAVAALGVSDADGVQFSVQMLTKDGMAAGTLTGQLVAVPVPSLADKVKKLEESRRMLRRVRVGVGACAGAGVGAELS